MLPGIMWPGGAVIRVSTQVLMDIGWNIRKSQEDINCLHKPSLLIIWSSLLQEGRTVVQEVWHLRVAAYKYTLYYIYAQRFLQSLENIHNYV